MARPKLNGKVYRGPPRWSRRPWMISHIQMPPIGLRETVLRVAAIKPFDRKRLSEQSEGLTRAVAQWAITSPEAFAALLAVVNPS